MPGESFDGESFDGESFDGESFDGELFDRESFDIDPDSLASMLSEALRSSRQLPHPVSAPRLSYGRHRGPAGSDVRIAAVAVTLFREDATSPTVADSAFAGQWMIPLTLRPTSLQHHGGQVCLPGGRVEPGEDPVEAALREFEEELGLRPDVIHHCGRLAPQYVYASNNLVHPIVAIIEKPRQAWQPDPVEVAEVIDLPLASLLGNRERLEVELKREVRQRNDSIDQFAFRAPAIRNGRHHVWGATALILDQLARILRPEFDS